MFSPATTIISSMIATGLLPPKMPKQPNTCARKACTNVLDYGFYRIYNEPSTGIPKEYCPACGRHITEYADKQYAAHGGVKLEYEMVTPHGDRRPTTVKVNK